MKKTLLFLLLLFLFGQSSAQSNSSEILNMQSISKLYHVQYTNSPLKIDGIDKEKAWENIPWTDEFVNIEGDHKNKPLYSTKVKMLWDDDNLYIYAKLEEPHVWGDIQNHDAIIYHNNDFEIFIKPYKNQTLYFEIEVNTLNTILDLLMNKPYRFEGQALLHWEAKGLKSAIHINGTNNNPLDIDKFWSVEMVIPFTALQSYGTKSTPSDGDFWRMNFSRVQWQHEIINGKYQRKKTDNKLLPEENWVWSPIGLVNMHYPERWGYIQFVDSSINTNSYPKSQKIEQFTWNIHYLQNLYKNKHKKYCSDLSEIQEGLDIITKDLELFNYELVLNKEANYYRIEIKDPANKISTHIDSYGKYQIQYD